MNKDADPVLDDGVPKSEDEGDEEPSPKRPPVGFLPAPNSSKDGCVAAGPFEAGELGKIELKLPGEQMGRPSNKLVGFREVVAALKLKGDFEVF